MTIPTNSNGGIARVTFRVRCETLGHGECVFLHPDSNTAQVCFDVDVDADVDVIVAAVAVAVATDGC